MKTELAVILVNLIIAFELADAKYLSSTLVVGRGCSKEGLICKDCKTLVNCFTNGEGFMEVVKEVCEDHFVCNENTLTCDDLLQCRSNSATGKSVKGTSMEGKSSINGGRQEQQTPMAETSISGTEISTPVGEMSTTSENVLTDTLTLGGTPTTLTIMETTDLKDVTNPTELFPLETTIQEGTSILAEQLTTETGTSTLGESTISTEQPPLETTTTEMTSILSEQSTKETETSHLGESTISTEQFTWDTTTLAGENSIPAEHLPTETTVSGGTSIPTEVSTEASPETTTPTHQSTTAKEASTLEESITAEVMTTSRDASSTEGWTSITTETLETEMDSSSATETSISTEQSTIFTGQISTDATTLAEGTSESNEQSTEPTSDSTTAASSSKAPITSTSEPTSTIAAGIIANNFTCKQEGVFEDSVDCTKFYVCYRYGRKLIAKHITCRTGSYYNTRVKRCVKGECQTITSTTSPLEFVCVSEGIFQHSGNCTMFYKCIYNGEGYEKHEFYCRRGSYFDPSRNRCVKGSCSAATTSKSFSNSFVIPNKLREVSGRGSIFLINIWDVSRKSFATSTSFLSYN